MRRASAVPIARSTTLLALLVCAPLLGAQAYHVESAVDRLGNEHLLLFNDTGTPIEAWWASHRCGPEQDGYSNADTLDSPVHWERLWSPEAGTWAAVVENIPPHRAASVSSWCNGCDNQVDGVLFADGSFAGSKAYARSLKAFRDGIASRLHFWVDFIRAQPGPRHTVESIRAEARELHAEDEANLERNNFNSLSDDGPSPLYGYWWGRLRVDEEIESWLDPKNQGERRTPTPQSTLADLEHWKARIDASESTKILNRTFPQISAPESLPSAAVSSKTAAHTSN